MAVTMAVPVVSQRASADQPDSDTERRRQYQCERKVAYQSRMLAENAAVLHGWDGRAGMTAYKCRWCPDWHVGHEPGKPKPRKRYRRRHRFGAKDAT